MINEQVDFCVTQTAIGHILQTPKDFQLDYGYKRVSLEFCHYLSQRAHNVGILEYDVAAEGFLIAFRVEPTDKGEHGDSQLDIIIRDRLLNCVDELCDDGDRRPDHFV